jgi:dTDP-glucose pyrophosphorylase
MKLPELAQLFTRPEESVRAAMERIDARTHGITLVVDAEGRLLDTITDGDVRRAVLKGTDLGQPVSVLGERRAGSAYPRPITGQEGIGTSEAVRLMSRHRIMHLPLLDADGRVVELLTRDDFFPGPGSELQAVVMAGGFGSRLYPLTEDLPKPMLPVAGRPMLEWIIRQIREAGIHQVNLTTHYQAEKIHDHFGDGRDFGVDIRYVREDRPLGTAGALGLLGRPASPLLVMFGDILTNVDIRKMVRFHQDREAELTIAVRSYDVPVPYGVVECEGDHVLRIEEKPTYTYFINAGIYLVEPSVLRCVGDQERLDMPELIERVLREGRRVSAFPIVEYWKDIGQHEQYAQAQSDAQGGFLQ